MIGTEVTLDEIKKQKANLLNRRPDLKEKSDNWNKEFNFRMKLVQARESVGLKQSDVEQVTGLKQRAISRLEKDMSVSPNIKTVIKYLSSIGYDLDIVKREQ